MDRENASDLLAFLAVARERSFTRAAAKLGLSQSALSQIVRALEQRLGVRLLNRTTRSVAPTQAGERLFQNIGPKFDEMDVELAALSELREKPAGTIRITAIEYAADSILMPALAKLLPKYPDIKVEVIRLWPEQHCRRAVRCRHSPGRAGGERHGRGAHWAGLPHGGGRRILLFQQPQEAADAAGPYWPQLHQSSLADLWRYLCLGIREERARAQRARRWPARVQRRGPMLNAALNGLGLAYLPEDLVQTDVSEGRLVKVLSDWCAPFSGYHLYYPSRHQRSPALAVLVDALRYRG